MAQWLRHPPTERGIPGSNPGVIGLFFSPFCSLRTKKIMLCFSLFFFLREMNVFLDEKRILLFMCNGRMAQWLRHPPTERGIPGSNPGVIDLFLHTQFFAVVEHEFLRRICPSIR